MVVRSTEKREQAVPKYFRKTPEAPDYGSAQTQMGLGGAMAFFGLLALGSDAGMCLALPLFIIGGIMVFGGAISYSEKKAAYDKAYNQAEPKPTDAQMDEWLNGDIQKIKHDAFKKLDLVDEQVVGDPNDPILVVGPSRSSLLAVGKDGIIRFSIYDVLIVHLTDFHLAAYKCTLDLATGTVKSESTQEYHYTDVVSVSTRTDNTDIFAVMVNGEQKSIASYQNFALSVASGEQIQVAIAFPQIEDIVKSGRLAPTGAEKAIKVIRARLREKKGGIEVA
jgi:hypothetical protein